MVWLCVLLLVGWAVGVGADLSGQVAVEARLFPHDGASEQHGNNLSVAVESEYYRDWGNGERRLVLAPFMRWDQGDDRRRSHFDLREFYWRQSFGSADVYIGVRKVFWGVTESLHLVDVVNQSDLIENLDTEDKLGQPMLQLTLWRDWGDVDLLVMPYFRRRTFPGDKGRLRPPLTVADKAVFEAGLEEFNPDVVARWSHILGDFDLALSHFYGSDREPRLVPFVSAAGQARLLPYYDLMHRSGLEGQYVRGDWLWKLEALYRDAKEGRSAAAVGGFEYTLFGLGGSVWDLGVVAEYQYDSRGAPFAPIGDNDAVLGGRLTFNDVQDTQLLVFVALDTDKGSRFASVEGSRRLGGNGLLRVEGRFFTNVDRRDPLFSLRRDDYIQVEYVRYF
jgi:hypothetical protein